jgi:hypothetical protein
MNRSRFSFPMFLGVQLFVVCAVALGFARLSNPAETRFREMVLHQKIYSQVPIVREQALSISPLYDDPSVVSDDDLALRAWGVSARFGDPAVMSGEEMRDFLLDHSRYAASWGDDSHTLAPLLIDRPGGVSVRWAMRQDTSVHHDHMLACLTEAGVSLSQPVYAPSGRNLTLNDILQEALRDFRLDEEETEWSTLAFASWLPPTKSWQTDTGRTVTFDMLAERLIRGKKDIGVCLGTHRVYSLMLLWRLDREYDILTDQTSAHIFNHLKQVRDLIVLSQFPDGHWPANWPDGKAAVDNPRPASNHDVIATGHHLEWLAIAPPELHPPREMVRKAARWLIEDTTSKTNEELYLDYTFYSHVGNALAMWRRTHPAEFWRTWSRQHPGDDQAGDPANTPVEPPKVANPSQPETLPAIPAPKPN